MSPADTGGVESKSHVESGRGVGESSGGRVTDRQREPFDQNKALSTPSV